FLNVKQGDIQRVYLRKSGSSRKKKVIIGAIIGGIVGLAIGARIGLGIDARAREAGPPFQDAPTTGDAIAIYSTLGGAAAGYGIGHLVGGETKRQIALPVEVSSRAEKISGGVVRQTRATL